MNAKEWNGKTWIELQGISEETLCQLYIGFIMISKIGQGSVECSVSAEYWGDPGESLHLVGRHPGYRGKNEEWRPLCCCWGTSEDEEDRQHSARMFYKAKHGGFQEDSESEEVPIILQGMEININFW